MTPLALGHIQHRVELATPCDLSRSAFEWAWRTMNEAPTELRVHVESKRYAETMLFDWGWGGLPVVVREDFTPGEWELIGYLRSVHSEGA